MTSIHTYELERQLLILRESVIDWTLIVDEARRDLDAAVEHFKHCVRVRDRVAGRLAELEAFASVVGLSAPRRGEA
jgi:hypothetical protein